MYSLRFTSYSIFTLSHSCSDLTTLQNVTVDFVIRLHIFIDLHFGRDDIENVFYEIAQGKGNNSISVDNKPFRFVETDSYISSLSKMSLEQMGSPCSTVLIPTSIPTYIKNLRVSFISLLLFCKQIAFGKDECHFSNKDVKLICPKHDLSLPLWRFLIEEDQTVRVCLDDVRDHFKSPLSKEIKVAIELGYLTHVCILISLVSLSITLFTYAIFKDLRTTPGILTMNLVVSIIISQALFTYGVSRLSLGIYCTVIGISTHYVWLSMFACTNVCSYHMYIVFKSIGDGNFADLSGTKRLFLYYIYSFLTPAIVVAANCIVLYLLFGTIGYGKGICFLSDSTSRVITMIIPAGIVCVINVFLFIRTAYSIMSFPDIKSTKQQRNSFIIFVKLFTITGALWTLQIIDSFINDVTVLTYLTTILNGLQGLFIFTSYVCNRNVLKLYLSCCKGRQPKPPTYASSTNSSQSSRITSLKSEKKVNIENICGNVSNIHECVCEKVSYKTD